MLVQRREFCIRSTVFFTSSIRFHVDKCDDCRNTVIIRILQLKAQLTKALDSKLHTKNET